MKIISNCAIISPWLDYMNCEGIYMKKHKKGTLFILITLALQLGTATTYAENIVGNNVTVDTSHLITVVQINAPVNGVSHNTYNSFSADTGVILNNSTTSAQTYLAGQISSNPHLQTSANIIVNEVTGTNASNLGGIIEVAGQKADVVIANPNGIIVNKLQFINTDRAVLTTGIPHNTNDALDSVKVQKGNISVNGVLNAPIVDRQGIRYDSINKVDLFAKTVRINSQILAKDAIHVITGTNNIQYGTNKVQPTVQPAVSSNKQDSTPQSNTKHTGVSLDVAALGGMYANTITLVGTDKGLGVNLEGTVDAIEGDLHIDTAGNLTITQHQLGQDSDGKTEEILPISQGQDKPISGENTSIHASKDIKIYSQNFKNNGNIISERSTNIQALQITNNGMIQANTLTTATKNLYGTGVISAGKDIHVKAENTINYVGGIQSNDGAIVLDSKEVKVNPNNILASLKDKIEYPQAKPASNDDPQEKSLPGKKVKSVSDNLKLNAVENLPSKTIVVTTNNDLSLHVDTKANKNHQPIIDKTRNGIDLVNIVQVDSQGVSLNKYTDFNVKNCGLVLNNATKYTNTTLAGYIDKNMFLAGRRAKTIVNEVTSTNESNLNGFIEVAGNPADVVIINPNGMAINGLGFINSNNIALNTLGNIDVLGKGFNGSNVENIKINTIDFSNNNSELWGKTLYVDASNSIVNAGKISVGNFVTNTNNLTNAGFIEGKNNISIIANTLTQNQGTIKASNELAIQTEKLNNSNHSLLETGHTISINGSVLHNENSNIVSNGELNVIVTTIKNSNDGVLATRDKLQIIGKNLTNENSNIISKGKSDIRLIEKLNNSNNSLISIDGDSLLDSKSVNNDNSKILLHGENTIIGEDFTNLNNGYVEFGGNTNVKGNNFNNTSSFLVSNGDLALHLTGNFTNEGSLLLSNKNVDIVANNIGNINKVGEYYGSEINVAGNLNLVAKESLENRSSDITVNGDVFINAPKIDNHKEKFTTDWVVTEDDKFEKITHLDQSNYYDADRRYYRVIHAGSITDETANARIISASNINVRTKNVSNTFSQIMAGKDLKIAADNVENIGYQGTIHFDDLGRDRHYWKYKEHRRWWLRDRWKYGHTDFPYENHQVFDEEPSINSERIAVLGSNGTTILMQIHSLIKP